MIRRVLVLASCAALGACATRAPSDHVALPPAPPRGEPVSTIGLSDADVRVQFGTPAFTRKDGTAQLWRYDGATCRAFFFLYPADNTMPANNTMPNTMPNTMNVRHVETAPRGTDMAADPKCLDALRLHPASPAPVS